MTYQHLRQLQNTTLSQLKTLNQHLNSCLGKLHYATKHLQPRMTYQLLRMNNKNKVFRLYSHYNRQHSYFQN